MRWPDHPFLGDVGLVFYWFCRKYEITRGELEFILRLHAVQKENGIFLRSDFDSNEKLLGWSPDRWERMQREEWFYVYQRRNGAANNYNKYKLTKQTNRRLDDLYKMLKLEKKIPETARSNPMFRYGEKGFDFQHIPAIKDFNRRVDEKRKNE